VTYRAANKTADRCAAERANACGALVVARHACAPSMPDQAELADYLARRYPRRTGGAGIGISATETYEHGRKAGRNIVLSRPINTETATRGRLLPSRGG